ncbi:MAG: hypothetical protein ACJAZM_000850 [Cyclobacteriaceae bacterium]|jgi:hypothetical protein
MGSVQVSFLGLLNASGNRAAGDARLAVKPDSSLNTVCNIASSVNNPAAIALSFVDIAKNRLSMTFMTSVVSFWDRAIDTIIHKKAKRVILTFMMVLGLNGYFLLVLKGVNITFQGSNYAKRYSLRSFCYAEVLKAVVGTCSKCQ